MQNTSVQNTEYLECSQKNVTEINAKPCAKMDSLGLQCTCVHLIVFVTILKVYSKHSSTLSDMSHLLSSAEVKSTSTSYHELTFFTSSHLDVTLVY